MKKQRFTRSMLMVLNKLIVEARPMTPKDLIEQLSIAPRTVRYSLRFLLELKLVRACPKLEDMRQHVYVPSLDQISLNPVARLAITAFEGIA